MWPFTSKNQVSKYSLNGDGVVPSTYAEKLDWHPAPWSFAPALAAARKPACGFDARTIAVLKIVGVAALLLCAAGTRRGDRGASAGTADILLVMA